LFDKKRQAEGWQYTAGAEGKWRGVKGKWRGGEGKCTELGEKLVIIHVVFEIVYRISFLFAIIHVLACIGVFETVFSSLKGEFRNFRTSDTDSFGHERYFEQENVYN
jgi:hypothetical protein